MPQTLTGNKFERRPNPPLLALEQLADKGTSVWICVGMNGILGVYRREERQVMHNHKYECQDWYFPMSEHGIDIKKYEKKYSELLTYRKESK